MVGGVFGKNPTDFKVVALKGLIIQILVFILNFLLNSYLIRNADTNTYGNLISLITSINLSYVILSMGVGVNARKLMPLEVDKNKLSQLFYKQLWFQLCASLIGSYLLILMVEYLNIYLSRIELFYLLVWSILLGTFNKITDYYKYTNKADILNRIILLLPILYFVTVVLLKIYIEDFNIYLLIISNIIPYLIITIIFLYEINKDLKINFIFYSKRELLKEIRFGLPLTLFIVSDIILNSGDRLLIAHILSNEQVGLYAPPYMLGSLVVILAKILVMILPPIIAKSSEEEVKKILTESVNIYLFISLAIFYFISFNGKEILDLYTGRNIDNKSVYIFIMVAFSSIFYGYNVIVSSKFISNGNLDVFIKFNLIGLIFNIGFNFILLSLFKNIIYSALVTIGTYFIQFLIINRITNNRLSGILLEFGRHFYHTLPILFSLFLINSLELSNSYLKLGLNSILSIILFYKYFYSIRFFKIA
jgi:O-antigen/teichoic acid export membrane protein